MSDGFCVLAGIKPPDVVHCSRGGHHNIICAEPIQNTPCYSAIAGSGPSHINAYVYLHKLCFCFKCKIGEVGESSELGADTRGEDALGDTVKNKSKRW